MIHNSDYSWIYGTELNFCGCIYLAMVSNFLQSFDLFFKLSQHNLLCTTWQSWRLQADHTGFHSSQEQIFEATVGMGSLKLDNWRPEKEEVIFFTLLCVKSSDICLGKIPWPTFMPCSKPLTSHFWCKHTDVAIKWPMTNVFLQNPVCRVFCEWCVYYFRNWQHQLWLFLL